MQVTAVEIAQDDVPPVSLWRAICSFLFGDRSARATTPRGTPALRAPVPHDVEDSIPVAQPAPAAPLSFVAAMPQAPVAEAIEAILFEPRRRPACNLLAGRLASAQSLNTPKHRAGAKHAPVPRSGAKPALPVKAKRKPTQSQPKVSRPLRHCALVARVPSPAAASSAGILPFVPRAGGELLLERAA